MEMYRELRENTGISITSEMVNSGCSFTNNSTSSFRKLFLPLHLSTI